MCVCVSSGLSGLKDKRITERMQHLYYFGPIGALCLASDDPSKSTQNRGDTVECIKRKVEVW